MNLKINSGKHFMNIFSVKMDNFLVVKSPGYFLFNLEAIFNLNLINMLRLTLLIFTLTPLWLKAQKPALPIDEKTGKTVYTGVVQVDGVSQADLYQRALGWFKAYFPNPTSVIKEQDVLAGKISGQHGIYIYKDLNGEQHKVGQVKYTIEVLVKDGRYKFTIDDIFRLQTPKEYAEEWLDESHQDKENRFGYARQVHKHMGELIENLKKTMSAAAVEEKEDW